MIQSTRAQRGRVVFQRVKITLGLRGGSSPRVRMIDGKFWHLDISSSSLGTVACFKGLSCSLIKAMAIKQLRNVRGCHVHLIIMSEIYEFSS